MAKKKGMNKRIKAKWVKALRSRKYKQVEGCLKDESEEKPMYCCLGVLCDLYVKEQKKSTDSTWDRWGNQVLPQEVQDWAGLDSDNPSFNMGRNDSIYDSIYESLSGLNDDRNYSFGKIAKVIEEKL